MSTNGLSAISKTGTINTTAVDDPATQVARTSAVMVLTIVLSEYSGCSTRMVKTLRIDVQHAVYGYTVIVFH